MHFMTSTLPKFSRPFLISCHIPKTNSLNTNPKSVANHLVNYEKNYIFSNVFSNEKFSTRDVLLKDDAPNDGKNHH